MPNKPRPENPARQVRVEDELWDGSMEAARERGNTLSEHVLRPALRIFRKDPEAWARYVKRHDKP